MEIWKVQELQILHRNRVPLSPWILADLTISLEDAAAAVPGIEKTFTHQGLPEFIGLPHQCPVCKGVPFMQGTGRPGACKACEGSGVNAQEARRLVFEFRSFRQDRLEQYGVTCSDSSSGFALWLGRYYPDAHADQAQLWAVGTKKVEA